MDTSLSPLRVEAFDDAGFEAIQWSTIGDFGAPEVRIVQWARNGGWTVFSQDLDAALRQRGALLEQGALVVDAAKSGARILPL